MSKKIVTCTVTLMMMASVFCFPAHGHGTEKTQNQAETAAVLAPQLKKPVGLKAKAVDSETIKLKWKKTDGASGYEVYKYSTTKKKYRRIGTTKKNMFKSTKLNADTGYRYRVKAFAVQESKKYRSDFSKAARAKTEKSDEQKIVAKAKKKIGARYSAGGSGPKAFDCSGFVYWVYRDADVDTKKKVIRTSSAGMYQSLKKYKVGSSIKSMKKAEAGDIILFKRGGSFSHAAIYAGKGRIIHAANARKGVISQKVTQLHNSGTKVAAVIRVVE